MKKLILIFFPLFASAQFGNETETPILWNSLISKNQLKEVEIKKDSIELEKVLKDEASSNHSAITSNTNITFQDFKITKVLSNGDKVYQLKITSEDALGMVFYFDSFKLEAGAKMWMYDDKNESYIGSYSSINNQEDQHFVSSVIEGKDIIIEYLEPKHVITKPFKLTKVYYFFRGLKVEIGYGNSDKCMINVECNEGKKYIDQSKATCRILIFGTNYASFCTGTLINNTKNDETPYIITANHCSMNAKPSEFVDWEFHFFFQTQDCNGNTLSNSKTIYKGCTYVAGSGQDYGIYSSDFLLLKLNQPVLKEKNHVFLGWDISENITSKGVCYHHPMGDVKKVSTYNTKPTLGSFSNLGNNTHLVVTWVKTENGFGVTQGGSSGSGLINEEGLLIGTLTGGASSCNRPYKSDFYGRMSIHWDTYNKNVSTMQLKQWLDPIESNVTSLKSLNIIQNTSAIEPTQNIECQINIENHELSISWEEAHDMEVNIFNSVGGFVLNQRIHRNDKIDLNQFSKGMYIIELNHSKNRWVKKVII